MNTTLKPQHGFASLLLTGLSHTVTSMTEALQKSTQAILKDTPSVISSQESEDGVRHCNSQNTEQINESGQQACPANRSPQQGKGSDKETSDTSGQCSSSLSRSNALSESLANKLRKRLDSIGSMEYRQTWNRKVTKSGRVYWAHTASAYRTSGKDSTGSQAGWGTPNTMDTLPIRSDEALQRAKEKAGCCNLKDQVPMKGWQAPRARGDAGGTRFEKTGVVKNLEDQVKLTSGYPTPAARDFKGVSGTGRQERKGHPSDTLPNAAATMSSSVETEKPAALNPAFTRWLMGYPVEWCMAAIHAHRNMPTKRAKRVT